MRLSTSLFESRKEVSKDLTTQSEVLLNRANLTYQVSSGLHIYSPLLVRVIKKAIRIVDEEMEAIGAAEVSMPILQPRSLWEQSGRWETYRDSGTMFILEDRKGTEYCLAPTGEEVAMYLARQVIRSYKQLPVCLYQIGEKFRDELRPRFGLMRGREFVMKDAYSFHDSSESCEEMYEAMRAAYRRIFDRFGLTFTTVAAHSGEMGGRISEEFHVLAESGEDDLLHCSSCSYGVNVEKVEQSEVCERCGASGLERHRGIEVGHIFQLGEHYSSTLEATFQDASGKNKTMHMGSYGIGISRAVAAIIEQNHDEHGIKWPSEVTPYGTIIIPASHKKSDLMKAATELYEQLLAAGEDVLFDDRTDSLGSKLYDAELIGIPRMIIVGRSWQQDQTFEVKLRESDETTFQTMPSLLLG